MTAALDNLVALSLQVAAVAAAAGLVHALLRVNAPPVAYMFWRGALVLCLALPFLQTPTRPTPAGGATAVDTSATATATIASTTTGMPAIDWPWWAGVTLAAGVVLRLLWLAAGCYRLRRLRCAGEAAPDSDHAELQAALATGADIRYTSAVQQPVTFGVRRPVVLLPMSLRQQPPAIHQAVLAHELVHVRRRDWCWVVAEELARAVCWFHPAMWWLISRIQQAREEVVDSEVVAMTGHRREYVEALLVFADDVPLAPAPAFVRRRQLFRRIMRLSTEDVMSARRIVVSAFVMAVVVAAAGWTSTWAFPLTAEQPTSMATLQAQPGPVEQRAKAAGAENPIPKRVYGDEPLFPSNAEGEYSSVTVTLRTIVDETGSVAELRLGGFSFKRGDISANISAGPTAATNFARFLAGTEFKAASGSAFAASSLLPMFTLFIEAAAESVYRWQFEPPRDGPLVVNTIVQFANGRPTTSVVTAARAMSTVASDGALRIGGAIRTPVKLKDVRPVYPADAKDARAQGVVIIEARIEGDGRVSATRVLRSIPLLDQAALDAVAQWEFEPTLLNGVATPVIMTVTVQFSLGQ